MILFLLNLSTTELYITLGDIYSWVEFSLGVSVFKPSELKCFTKAVGSVLQALPFILSENRIQTPLKQLQMEFIT